MVIYDYYINRIEALWGIAIAEKGITIPTSKEAMRVCSYWHLSCIIVFISNFINGIFNPDSIESTPVATATSTYERPIDIFEDRGSVSEERFDIAFANHVKEHIFGYGALEQSSIIADAYEICSAVKQGTTTAQFIAQYKSMNLNEEQVTSLIKFNLTAQKAYCPD